MELIEAAASGEPTARKDGLYLHSRHDPRREAERSVEQAGPNESSLVVILGACLPHHLRALRSRWPALAVVSVHYSDYFRDDADGSTLRWYPGTGVHAEDFFASFIDEASYFRVKVIDWQPAARAYPRVAREVRAAMHQALREVHGSILTTSAFGRRWLRNAVRNYLLIDSPLSWRPAASTRPICICASGASLAGFLPLAKRLGNRLALWALPSALSALCEAGLCPEVVVWTDPGNWAAAHIRDFALRRPRRLPLLLMPLTAGTGAWMLGWKISFIDQGSFLERQLLGPTVPSPWFVPARGTVAATALELALPVGVPVIMAGLDLCLRGASEHVRPSAFAGMQELAASRTAPLCSRLAARGLETATLAREGVRTSAALDTYAGWFARNRRRFAGRVLRWDPSPVDCGLPAIDEAGIMALLDRTPARGPAADPTEAGHPGARERRRRVRILLDSLRQAIESYLRGNDSGAEGFRLLCLVEPAKAYQRAALRAAGASPHGDESLRESIAEFLEKLEHAAHEAQPNGPDSAA